MTVGLSSQLLRQSKILQKPKNSVRIITVFLKGGRYQEISPCSIPLTNNPKTQP